MIDWELPPPPTSGESLSRASGGQGERPSGLIPHPELLWLDVYKD